MKREALAKAIMLLGAMLTIAPVLGAGVEPDSGAPGSGLRIEKVRSSGRHVLGAKHYGPTVRQDKDIASKLEALRAEIDAMSGFATLDMQPPRVVLRNTSSQSSDVAILQERRERKHQSDARISAVLGKLRELRATLRHADANAPHSSTSGSSPHARPSLHNLVRSKAGPQLEQIEQTLLAARSTDMSERRALLERLRKSIASQRDSSIQPSGQAMAPTMRTITRHRRSVAP